jgi:hypothetical protein
MAISNMGGCCVRCGYNESWRALEFDHKDGRPKHRKCGAGAKACDRGSSKEFNKRLREGTLSEVYQLLCCNCHAVKTYEEGDHRKKAAGGADEPPLPLFD